MRHGVAGRGGVLATVGAGGKKMEWKDREREISGRRREDRTRGMKREQKSVSLLCVNVRGLRDKVVDFQHGMRASEHLGGDDVVGVLETWLRLGEPIARLDGFQWTNHTSGIAPGDGRGQGGVGVWMRESLGFDVVGSTERMMWVRVPGLRCAPTYVGMVYAPAVNKKKSRTNAVAISEFWR